MMKPPSRTKRKRRVMGGAMPGPARLPPVGGLGKNFAESAGYSMLNTVVTPLRSSLNPPHRATNAVAPKDSSKPPITLPKQDLYSHPDAKTAYPRNPNTKAKKTSKGLGRGGARPV